MSASLTHARLLELLDYDASTGVFRWRVATSNRVKVGAVAGKSDTLGYVVLGIYGQQYKAHRLAWFYTHGVWPSRGLDHIDRNTANNRIENLRLSDQSENIANTVVRKNNKLNVKGIHFDASRNKFVACLKKDRRQVFHKRFDTLEEAKAAYAAAAARHYGEFART
jgi:hypothetical protein